MDAAIGFVVAHGDRVDRARLRYLRTGVSPAPEILADAEIGQSPEGGWPATWAGAVASVDATCFRLSELDDLGGLGRPAAQRALVWLAGRQQPDGTWEEDESLLREAPPWAQPGDPEARLYLTAGAGYWLALAGPDSPVDVGTVRAAAQAFAGQLRPDGTWPSFLAAGWLAAALLHRQGMFYESVRIQLVLADRLPGMSPADVASMAAALRRAGVGEETPLLAAARRRLAETQRSDGGWASDDGAAFDVHTTLAAIRACR
ncbi:MAG TPA: prenyltransferase/squalene oxidase repeat-containing protein [Micromonosporaceae bacterium]